MSHEELDALPDKVAVTIREKFKLLPLCGERTGHDHGPTTGYEIVGPTGVCDTARTQAAAERKRAEWQAYYDKLETTK